MFEIVNGKCWSTWKGSKYILCCFIQLYAMHLYCQNYSVCPLETSNCRLKGITATFSPWTLRSFFKTLIYLLLMTCGLSEACCLGIAPYRIWSFNFKLLFCPFLENLYYTLYSLELIYFLLLEYKHSIVMLYFISIRWFWRDWKVYFKNTGIWEV